MNDDERLEELALECFDRLEREGESALDALYADHPDDAATLRRIVGRLSRIGLIGDPSCERVAAGQRLGDFCFERLLGAGGMGVVWLATQESLGRQVALKLMRPGVLGSQKSRKRFQREVELLSLLDDPGICTVYEAGEIEDTPYLAMRFVDGESLAARIRRQRDHMVSPTTSGGERSWIRSSLELIEKVARSLHAAHHAGVIHRDVKPANIMIDGSGAPFVLDFGLARSDEEGQQSLTQSGDLLGTPAYMSPEQISGAATDRRSDVYSLGVTLYECLTLHCPFANANRESLYRQILAGDVRDPRAHNRRIDNELRVVLGKAMALDPKDRFATAEEFAEELARILRHEPIRTRRTSVGLRLYRWTQRNPLAASALIIVSVALLLSLYLLAENARARKQSGAYAEAMAATHDARENPILGFQRAREALRRSRDPIVCQELQAIMGDLHQVARLDEHEGRIVRRVTWSADGKLLVSASEAWLSAPVLHDASSGSRLATLDILAKPWGMAIAPDSSLIAVGGTVRDNAGNAFRKSIVRLFDVRGQRVAELVHADKGGPTGKGTMVRCVRFSPDGHRLLACGNNGNASLWERKGQEWNRVQTLRGACAGTIWDAAFSRDGSRIITAGGYGVTPRSRPHYYDVCIWDGTGKRIKVLTDHKNTIWSIAVSTDSFATASHDGKLRFWSLDGEPLRPPLVGKGPFTSVVVNQSGKRFVSTSMSGSVRIHDQTGQVLEQWTLPGRGNGAVQGSFSPNGLRVAVTGTKQFIDVFDLLGRPIARLRGHLQVVTDVAFSPVDGSRLASASYDGTVRLWSLDPLYPGIVQADETEVSHMLPFGEDDQILAAGWKSGRVTIWKDAKQIFEDAGDGTPMTCVNASASRDGRKIALAYVKGERKHLGEIRIYSTSAKIRTLQVGGPIGTVLLHPDGRTVLFSQGRLIGALDLTQAQPKPVRWGKDGLNRANITTLQLAPSGREFVTGNALGGCILWDLETRSRIKGSFMEGHRTNIRSCVFSGDGTRLLTASLDGTARLWDLRTFKEIQRFEGHHGSVQRACFSPDETQVLTASGDDTLWVWDRHNGTQILQLRGHAADVRSACFVANGEQVVSASLDGTLRWWWLDPDDLARAADKLAEQLGIPWLSKGKVR